MAKLTPKQQQFVVEYLIDLNATQAAIRAGYSPRTAEQQGFQLLKKTSVAAAVQAAMDERAERTEINADYVLETITDTIERCKQARQVFDRRGQPVMIVTPAGDLAAAYVFDATAVLKGAELLGRHLKLFTDKVEHGGKVELVPGVRARAEIEEIFGPRAPLQIEGGGDG